MVAAVLCERLCKPFGIEPPLFPRRLDFFVKNRAFSTARAQRELGFSPKVDLEQGARRTLEWYRSAGWL
jgi:nucleoside-diphosphate-sugar epimerase